MPSRTCVACGRKTEKSELVRLAALNGIIIQDAEYRMKGRGAYVCRQSVCLRRFLKNEKKIARAFRQKSLVFSAELMTG